MAKVEVEMPKMGESITEGTIIAWHKQPGEAVELDETLLEIGTDKVDTEVPSPAAGTLQEVLVEEGDTVEVGTAIAVIETEAEAEGGDEPATAPPDEAEEEAAEADAQEADVQEEPAAEEADATSEEEKPDAQEEEADQEAGEEVQPAQASGDGASSGASGGEVVEVVMPKMGESITEGTIIAWHKQPGEAVELDETLLEIGTDKVDTEVPSPAAGTLQEVLVEEGDTVEVGMAIAKIATGEGASTGGTSEPEAPQAAPQGDGAQREAEEPQTSGEASAPSGDGAMVETEAQEAEPVQRKGSDGRFYSPLVRSIAEKEGLSMQELESIEGSGREGRVSKEDVLEYVEARGSQPAQQPSKKEAPAARRPASDPSPTPKPIPSGDLGGYDGRVEIVEMDRMRQIIAEHMVRSKATSAHVTSFTEADVTNLVKLREKNKASFQKREGVKLTYTPFFVQAAVEALREHPILNSSVEEKRIVIKKDFHIGIAVALGKTGLLAPVVRDAGQKNISGLARTAADLAERARKKQLQPDELQGGTFTVTNIGSLGSLMGTPIINQPQVGILAVGAIKKRPVVVEDAKLGDIIAIRSMMYLSLSYDHRIIDGAMAASFLHKIVGVLEGYGADAEL